MRDAFEKKTSLILSFERIDSKAKSFLEIRNDKQKESLRRKISLKKFKIQKKIHSYQLKTKLLKSKRFINMKAPNLRTWKNTSPRFPKLY